MEEKNNNGLKITVVILSFLVVALAGFIIFDKVFHKPILNDQKNNSVIPNENKDNDNKEINSENEKKLAYERIYVNCQYDSNEACKFSRNNVDFELNSYNISGFKNFKLLVNGKEILNDFMFLPHFIDVIDDEVLIFLIDGTDIRSATLYSFDLVGNKLLEIKELDKNVRKMVIDDNKTNGADYTFKNNKIIIDGTRISNGPSIITENETIDISDYKKVVGHEEEIVRGLYEIEYLGNRKFSEVKNIKYTKLKDDSSYQIILNSPVD